jgi:hypothetical protein
MNPRKVGEIKEKVGNILNAGFIYPVPPMEWVSNPVPVDNK